MQPIVLYHAACTDGYGAAFAAWLSLGDDADYVPVYHGRIQTLEALESALPDLMGRDVYIIDFSFTPELTREIFRRARRTVWLDHHATSFETWCSPGYLESVSEVYVEASQDGRCSILLDNRKSGALLAWEHFFPGTPTPRLLAYVDDYDRQALALPKAREFNVSLLSQAPWSFPQWRQLVEDLGTHQGPSTPVFEMMLREGTALRRSQAALVASMTPDAQAIRIPGWPDAGLALPCPSLLANDVGEELVSRCGTYAVCWHMQDGVVKCSLRSQGEYNVEQLAVLQGGGGHKNMAAFRVPLETFATWLVRH